MKKTLVYSGQRFKKEIIDYLQTSKEDAIKERFTDYTYSGIIPMSPSDDVTAMQFEFIPVTANTYLAPYLTILPGIAYNRNGERIEIPEIDPIVDPSTDDGYDDIKNPSTYDANNPLHTTDNGLSVQISTPRSTGAINIPLVVGNINKLWIGYLAITDDGETGNDSYTLRKDTLEKQFYKQYDGYKIVISETNPGHDIYVYLGSVDLQNKRLKVEQTADCISYDDREYARYTNQAINQGAGSKLDADMVDGKQAAEFELLSNKNQTNGYVGLTNGQISLNQIPQGADSTLNADTVDGKHVKDVSTLSKPEDADSYVAGDLITLGANNMFPSIVIPPYTPPVATAWPAPFRFYIQEPLESAIGAIKAMAEYTGSRITGLYCKLTVTGSMPSATSLTIKANVNGTEIGGGTGTGSVKFTSGDWNKPLLIVVPTTINLGDIVSIDVEVVGAITTITDATILLTVDAGP